MTENLNLEFHIKRLVIKALNKFNSDTKAAEALGISIRTLYHWKRKFKLVKRVYENQESSEAGS